MRRESATFCLNPEIKKTLKQFGTDYEMSQSRIIETALLVFFENPQEFITKAFEIRNKTNKEN